MEPRFVVASLGALVCLVSAFSACSDGTAASGGAGGAGTTSHTHASNNATTGGGPCQKCSDIIQLASQGDDAGCVYDGLGRPRRPSTGSRCLWQTRNMPNLSAASSELDRHGCPPVLRQVVQWPSLRLETIVAPPGACSEHAHSGVTILYAEAGEFHQVSETALGKGRRTFVRSGMAYALMPGQRHRASWAGTLKTASLYVGDALTASLAEDGRPYAPMDGVLRATEGVRVCFEALSRAARVAPRSRIVAESAAMLLLDSITLGPQNPGQSNPTLRPLEPATVRRITEYVDASLGENLSVADLARIAAQSTSHFARTFRATTGLTPAAFVRDRRLERARTVLRAEQAGEPRVLLGDLALELGFASQAHFTNVFRRHVGLTPGAYRRAAART